MIKKSLMPGFITLIRVLNSLILCVNSLLRCLGNFLIKHVDNCHFASQPKCRQDHILDIFPANSRETGNIIPETISRRTGLRTRISPISPGPYFVVPILFGAVRCTGIRPSRMQRLHKFVQPIRTMANAATPRKLPNGSALR